MSKFRWNPFVLEGEAPGSVRHISMSGSKAEAKPTRVEMWSDEQKALFREMWPSIQAGFTGDVAKYPGQMFVPKTGEEAAYLEGAPKLASYLGGVRGKLGQPAFEVTPETTEQYYQESIKAPMMKEWQESVEPMIREAYAGPGYWGSARAGAQQKGAQTLATTLGAARGELAYKDEMARRESLEAAAGREATYGAPVAQAEAGILGTAGQYSRMIDQEQVQADFQRWLMGEEVGGVKPSQYNPFLQLAFQALGLEPFALGTTSTSKSFGASGSFTL